MCLNVSNFDYDAWERQQRHQRELRAQRKWEAAQALKLEMARPITNMSVWDSHNFMLAV